MPRSHLVTLALAALWLAMSGSPALAEKAPAPKTVTGQSSCATCDGVTAAGHSIMLVDKDGLRWVLTGKSDSYKKAHEERKLGKTMTATLAGEPQTKKDDNGKEYKEVEVSEVTIG
jgi:hypothetical protein